MIKEKIKYHGKSEGIITLLPTIIIAPGGCVIAWLFWAIEFEY